MCYEFFNRLMGFRDIPSDPVVKNPPCNAGDVGLIPGRGTKILHVVGQVSPRATLLCLHASMREPTCRKLQSPCALHPAHLNCRREHPHAATREKPEYHNKETVCRNERSRMPQ